MYYHIIEEGNGEKAWQGCYSTPEEAQEQKEKLTDMFPNSFFYVEAYQSSKEPYCITI